VGTGTKELTGTGGPWYSGFGRSVLILVGALAVIYVFGVGSYALSGAPVDPIPLLAVLGMFVIVGAVLVAAAAVIQYTTRKER
jgi:hypothetical protein